MKEYKITKCKVKILFFVVLMSTICIITVFRTRVQDAWTQHKHHHSSEYLEKQVINSALKIVKLHKQIQLEQEKLTIINEQLKRNKQKDSAGTTAELSVDELSKNTVNLFKEIRPEGWRLQNSNEDLRMKYRGNCKRGEYYGFKLQPLLKAWDELAEKNNITYFLTAGALIGSFIHEDLIDCDRDLDVLVDKPDMVKLEQIQSERKFDFTELDNVSRLILQADWREDNVEKRKRYTCWNDEISAKIDECSFIVPMGRLMMNRLYIDIFSYSRNNNQVSNLIYQRSIHEKHVFPLKRCKLIQVSTYCPVNTEAFLKVHYGKTMFDYLVKHSGDIKQNVKSLRMS